MRELFGLLVILFGLKLCHSTEVNMTVSNAPKIVDQMEKLNHPEGTNATFTCSIGSGELVGLTFEWRKDDTIINFSRAPKVRIATSPENFQSTLRVFDLKPEDGGVYSCLAKNKYGQDKISTKLSVKAQLKWIEEPPKKVEAGIGKAISISCSAAGSSSVQWRKLDEQSAFVASPELHLAAVRQEDAGLYECRAKNGVDEDLVALMELKVLGK